MGRNSNTVAMQRQLVQRGYKLVRQTGGHKIFKNDKGQEIVVNLRLNKMVMKRLQKEM